MRKDSEVIVGRHFPSLNRASCFQSIRIKHKIPNKINGKKSLRKLNHKLFNNLPNVMNFRRVTIPTTNKSTILI